MVYIQQTGGQVPQTTAPTQVPVQHHTVQAAQPLSNTSVPQVPTQLQQSHAPDTLGHGFITQAAQSGLKHPQLSGLATAQSLNLIPTPQGPAISLVSPLIPNQPLVVPVQSQNVILVPTPQVQVLPPQEMASASRSMVQGLAVNKGGLIQAVASQRPGVLPAQMPPGQVTSVQSLGTQGFLSSTTNVVQGQQFASQILAQTKDIGKAPGSLALGSSQPAQHQVYYLLDHVSCLH